MTQSHLTAAPLPAPGSSEDEPGAGPEDLDEPRKTSSWLQFIL